MDWIHCNNCFVQPGDTQGKKFSITNCGHIFCFDCVDPQKSGKCLLCHSPCRNMILTAKMSKELEIYFSEPLSSIHRIFNVLEFQKNHRTRLGNFRKEQLHSLHNEIALLKQELMLKEKKIASINEEKTRMSLQLLEYQQEIASLRRRQFTENSPIHQVLRANCSSSQKPTPPTMGTTENHRNILKRPPEGLNFFPPKLALGDNNAFIASPAKLSGSYRTSRTFDSISTITPNSNKWSPQRDPFFRKIKLPGDRVGKSPATITALHRLTLSKQSSASKKYKGGHGGNSHSEYFKLLPSGL